MDSQYDALRHLNEKPQYAAQAIQPKGAIGGNAGQAWASSQSYPDAPPMPPDTVANLLALIRSQADELVTRSSDVASFLAGPIPQASEKDRETENCVLAHLQFISRRLQVGCSELERARGAMA